MAAEERADAPGPEERAERAEAALEEALEERNRLWAELQRRTADERELEHWRARALDAEGTLGWRLTRLARLARRALDDPAAALYWLGNKVGPRRRRPR